MRTQENVTIYHCDFCKKQLKRKHAMLKHEDGCTSNPKNKIACFSGCVYLEQIDIEIDVFVGRHYDGEPILNTRKSFCFKCLKKDQLMYSFSAEKLDLPTKYPDDFEDQEPMPKVSCELFKESELPF